MTDPLRSALGRLLGRHHRAMLVSGLNCAACNNYSPTAADIRAALAAAPPALDVERLADIAVMALGEVMTQSGYAIYNEQFREHLLARLRRAAAYAADEGEQ